MNQKELQDIIDNLINKNTKTIKEYSVEINKGKPFFNKDDYEIIEGVPKYFKPDEYGRSNGAIAIVSIDTMPFLINKNLKYLPPYGWNDVIQNDGFFEQCHIIAYSLSARFTNRKNIFIGTEHLNTSIMAHWENEIKNQIKKKNDKILYRVTIKYKGKNQIPTGILIEAQSLNTDYCLCEFCYNIQPNVEFNYKDAKIIKDNRQKNEIEKTEKRQIKNTKANEINIEDESMPKRTGLWKDYIINKRTKTYHLRGEKENCSSIKNVNPKYLIETTVKEEKLIDLKYKTCKKCN